MNKLSGLMGLVVMTSPLFLIVIWVPVCLALAILVGRKFIRKKWPFKFAGGLVVFFVFLALPVADEIAGRIYLNHLCETKAGIKVYQTIELPDKYWDEEGGAKIFNKYGYIDREFWRNTLDESHQEVNRYSQIFSIYEDKTKVMLKTGNVKLGEILTFRFLGGWTKRNFTSGGAAISCEFIRDPKFSREFYGQLFTRPDLQTGDK